MKNIREGKHKRTGLISLAIVCLLLLSSAMPVFAEKEPVNRETVKVGFFAWEGYQEEDGEGIRSGYGYDFLKMVQEYTNWRYEYVGYDQSWSEMLTMLEDGRVDVVTSAQKIPEWEQRFDYSDSPIGTSSTILTVRGDDERFVVEDVVSYNGMVVASLKGSSRNARFAQFAKERGFTYSPVYYDTQAEMEAALKNHDVDAILSSNLRTLNDETVLEEFDPVDFYAIVRKGDYEHLDAVNDAISRMDMNAPGWRLNLKNKYYPQGASDIITLSRSEKEYIEMLKENGTILKVVSNPDLAPYSYFQDGKAVGIAPRIFEELANRLDIPYEFVSFETYEEYNEYVKAGNADVDLTCFSSYGLAEKHGVVLSNTYMNTSLAMLSMDTFDGDIRTIAEVNAVGNNTTYGDELLDQVASKNYDTHQECVQAVLNGDVDVTYMYTYTAHKAVEEDARNRLMYSIMPEYEVNIAIGVNETLDYRLLTIINKGIASVQGDYAQDVMEQELANIAE